MATADEMVLAVRRELFDSLGAFQGLEFNVAHYFPSLLARENNRFIPRSSAETDPGFKQIIPYALLTHEGRVLHYVRGKKVGEQRLASKGSIGIGGHLNELDENLFSVDETSYQAGVQREVTEELILDSPYQNDIRALLNDDSTEVGRVHLGIVHVFTLETADVTKREAAITQMAFLTPDELRARRHTLETWSQMCVDQLDKLLAVY